VVLAIIQATVVAIIPAKVDLKHHLPRQILDLQSAALLSMDLATIQTQVKDKAVTILLLARAILRQQILDPRSAVPLLVDLATIQTQVKDKAATILLRVHPIQAPQSVVPLSMALATILIQVKDKVATILHAVHAIIPLQECLQGLATLPFRVVQDITILAQQRIGQ
jgi:hypothetical protein